jgi:Uncharacterized protein conserved in bacteria
MNAPDPAVVQASVDDSVPAAAIGAALRQLRESRGWTLADVSLRLKFSPRQIDALENERWDELPTGVSLRGLVRNYARLLGVDPAAMLSALQPHLGAPAASPVRPSVQGRGVMQHEERSGGGSIAWIVAILAVLAAALGYAFWHGWLPAQWLSLDWLSPSAS